MKFGSGRVTNRIWLGTAVLGSLVLLAASHAQKTALVQHIRFRGHGVGGSLTLAPVGVSIPRSQAFKFITIETAAGESPDSIAAKLSAASERTDGFRFLRSESFGDIHGNDFYLVAGTEIGFGIPEAPMFLSMNFNPETRKTSLHWQNPVAGYDDLRIARVIEVNPAETEWTDEFGVCRNRGIIQGFRSGIAYQDATPSNIGAIQTDEVNPCIQMEAGDPPFTANIACNWVRWEKVGGIGEINYTEGQRESSFDDQLAHRAQRKANFQILLGHGDNVTGGTYRKFLGLAPGHTYRVSIRLNTLNMNPSGNWSYSAHATHNGTAGTLTPRQMAGLDPLPDGSLGGAAGRLVRYHSAGRPDVPPGPPSGLPPGPPAGVKPNWTKGAWIESATGGELPDITIPPGCDSLTVWLRLSGSGDISGVGMDWLALEDLTCTAMLQSSP